MKTTIYAAFAAVLALTTINASANTTYAQQQLSEHIQQVTMRIEQQSGRYLTVIQAENLKLNLMAEHLIIRYPNADLKHRLEHAKLDYQLTDISQQQQLMINLQVLEDDGDGVIPP